MTAPQRLLPAQQDDQRLFGLLQLRGLRMEGRGRLPIQDEFTHACSGRHSRWDHELLNKRTRREDRYRSDGRSMMSHRAFPSPPDPALFQNVVGIDRGSQSCSFGALKPDKSTRIKPRTFANTAEGFALLFARREQLGAAPEQVLIGLEATSRDGENLSHALLNRGYHLCLLHPGQTHHFARTSWLAGQNGSVRRHGDGACFAQWRSQARVGAD